ncbi:PLATZ transcription factor protein [Dioscorea alata]|uniref:PLATZ transcription factor protein n=1 Tax=Dioscorea alata TaxID=55571 RepID=A0ACB7VYD4_DIOAL|nr:PLATZ transcription factor protein [Dioscorea alata]
MGLGKAEKENACPTWLHPLLQASFFTQCNIHLDSSRSECNMYCLDCKNGALCSSCLVYHHNHRFIQIRRSSYHDVIRVSEIQMFLDITGVQTYIINGARVVFLNGRPQQRLGKGVTNTCTHCRRSLLDAFAFCSLGCKLAKTVKIQRKLRTDDESGEEMNSSKDSKCSYGEGVILECISKNRKAKRRKGIPKRAPMGVWYY